MDMVVQAVLVVDAMNSEKEMVFYKDYVSFAGSGPNSRNTQIFIAYKTLDFLNNFTSCFI